MHRPFAKYAGYENAYRKRLLIIVPISMMLVGVLFVTSDVVPYSEIEQVIGWEGEMQILPQITIMKEDDPFENTRKASVLRTMSSMDLQLIDETGQNEGPTESEDPVPKPDELDTPELDLADVPHIPRHTDVPYADDYVILHMVQPEYPPAELLEGVEGDVWVEILVNEEGLVEDAWVLTAVGPKTFERSSLIAVRQFRFRPPIVDGEPSPMWIRFHIFFRLVS